MAPDENSKVPHCVQVPNLESYDRWRDRVKKPAFEDESEEVRSRKIKDLLHRMKKW